MPKKNMTEAEKKAWGEKMRQAREAKSKTVEVPVQPEVISDEQDLGELKKQMQEVLETNALLKAALLGNNQGGEGLEVGAKGNLVGQVDKYLIDPNNYPNPSVRLSKEPRLVAVNFLYNYELDYEVGISAYETKTGVNMREPRFTLQLNRIVLDEDGGQTDKRWVVRRLIFHEDPQAALVIARESGIDIPEGDQKNFLDEMRYVRAKNWIFDVFWPKPAQPQEQIREEVIGGTIVQVFTKNSEQASEIDFSKLDTKLK